MTKKISGVLLFLFFLTGLPGQDFDFGSSDNKKKEDEESTSKFSLRGSVSAEASVQTEDFRWIRLGPALHLILDYPNDIVNVYGEATGRINSAYSIEKDDMDTVKNYTGEAILRELYLQKSIGFLTITAGNKMVVWSEADILPVMDLISVADLTESLFANPEEARLGQNIIGLDFFFKPFEVNLVFSPYPVFDRVTSGGHPYALIPGTKINPDPADRGVEFAGRIKYFKDKLSLSLASGYVNNRLPLFSLNSDMQSLDPVYDPSPFAGIGGTLVLSPFLLKFEARYSFNMPFQKITNVPVCNVTCYTYPAPDGVYFEDQAAATIGFDLNAGDGGFFTLEGSAILPESNFNRIDKASWFLALGWSKSLFRDQVTVSVFVISTESIKNIIMRASVEWSITDNLSLSTQYTGIWMKGDVSNSAEAEYYKSLDKFDRYDLMIKYHFSISG